MSDRDVKLNIEVRNLLASRADAKVIAYEDALREARRQLDRQEQVLLAMRSDLAAVQAEFEACRHEFTPGRMGWCVHERSGPGHEYLLVCGHEADAEIHRTLRVILGRKVGTERKDTTP